ncbi:MAG: GNAT family N-acetyltransferase [Pseudomonadota bacterium]|nr:GNAT family N-acetyltransferase [Pseudomonadota bacterium]
MIVDLAVPGDVPTIMTVERTPGFEDLVGRWSREEHLAEMAKPSVRYFVGREADAIVAFAIVQGLEDSDRKAHLKRIAVSRPGAGIGTELLCEVIRWVFTQTETNRLDLDVFAGNERAKRAYEKAGFVTEGLLREYHRMADGTYRDMWLMSILRREWAERDSCG